MVTDCDGRLCDHVELPIRQKGKLSKPQRVPHAGASSFGIGFGRRPFHVTSAQVPLPTTMDRREDTGQRIERATSLIAVCGTAKAPLIGYMRVSKADGSQVLDLQRDALLTAGVSERHLYNDTASGKKDDRPGLAACLQALREGDTLVVWKLDRLGRSLRHLVNVVHELTSGGVGLRVLTGCCNRHDHACW